MNPDPTQPAQEQAKPKYYIASKTKHANFWRANRAADQNITSTWIDEAGEGETADYSELASRCLSEIKAADFLVLYCEAGEVLKGALLEAGMALALGKHVRCVGDCESISRVFKEHPLWSSHPSILNAIAAQRRVTPTHAPSTTNPAEIGIPLAHAPSEGQTGETPETDAFVAMSSAEVPQQCDAGDAFDHAERVAKFARQLEAQRDSARKTSQFWKDGMDDAIKECTTLRALEAQLSAMRSSLAMALRQWRAYAEGTIVYDGEDYHIPTADDLEGKQYREGLAILEGTSGQALLDRLAQAEKDTRIVDELEKKVESDKKFDWNCLHVEWNEFENRTLRYAMRALTADGPTETKS